MRRYTASEAIGPAWEHTTELLWKNGRWLTGLKIALVAVLAEMSLGFNWNFWQPSNSTPATSSPLHAISTGVALVLGFLFFLVGLVFFYVGSRFQLALYDMVAHRSIWVAPSWEKYGSIVWRWIGLKLLLVFGMLVVTIPAGIFFAVRTVHSFSQTKPSVGHVLSVMLPFLAVVFAALIIFIFFYWAVRDFVMPSLVLEGTTLGFALHRFRLFLAAEPGPILLYLFLRLVLSFFFGIICYIAFLIALAVSAIPFTIVGAIVYMPFRNNTGSAHTLAIVACVILGILFAILATLLAIAFFGTLITFYFSWGAYFLGGRYPMLGDLLEPAAIAPVFTPPPSFPTGDDSENGPHLPLNPQPAS